MKPWDRSEKVRTFASLLLVLAIASTSTIGCAQKDWIESTLVTVDVTGVWQGRASRGLGSTGMEMTLQQRGPKVTGQLSLTPSQVLGAVGPIEGTIAGDTCRFRSVRGGEVSGELQVNGDEMTGWGTTQYGPATYTLRRQP
jgi:hypothetical protein